MRCYIDPDKVGEKFKQIAAPLRPKALLELEKVYTSTGFKPRGSGQDKVGTYFDVDIRRGTDMAKVYEFLQTADVCAVTVEPADVERIYGKNLTTLGIRRTVEINGASAAGLELIEPDSLADAFENAADVGVDFTGLGMDADAIDNFVTNDLIASGHMTQSDLDAADKWLEAKPEPMGLRIGDRFDYPDMGEFAPDYSEEEGEEW